LKYIFLLLWIQLSGANLTAQEQSLYEKICAVQKKGEIHLDPMFLIGLWTSIDSSTCGLHFKCTNNEVKLFYDDKTTFIFNKFTNLKHASTFGIFYNWPPQYCFIDILDNHTIAIQFYSVGSYFSVKKLYRKP
jgi:hypothetical protein